MDGKKLLIVSSVLLFSCQFLFPVKTHPAPQETPIQEPSTNLAFIGFTEVRIRPADGSSGELLALEAVKAHQAGLQPVVEFDAEWCPPCLAIQRLLEEKNEFMLAAYDGTYIIKMDVDEWDWKDGVIGKFHFDAIPVYFKLDSSGNPTGEIIDGSAWQEDIPANIAPVMDSFFHD